MATGGRDLDAAVVALGNFRDDRVGVKAATRFADRLGEAGKVSERVKGCLTGIAQGASLGLAGKGRTNFAVHEDTNLLGRVVLTVEDALVGPGRVKENVRPSGGNHSQGQAIRYWPRCDRCRQPGSDTSL